VTEINAKISDYKSASEKKKYHPHIIDSISFSFLLLIKCWIQISSIFKHQSSEVVDLHWVSL